ncbi:MAG: HAD family phosphatase [Phycisphaerae bacterium]|jgi:beta-phosphoglucomutase
MTTGDAFGVIFDMDGVLVDSAESHFESWVRLARECNRSVTREQFAQTFGRQNRDIIPILFGDGTERRLTALANRKEELYRDLIRQKPPIVDGASRLLHDLHEAGIRVAVGSSAPKENIDLILATLGVGDCVSTVVSGDDHERGKPDPQVFLLAARGLDLDPSRCVVVEDAPVGIQAARAAQMRTVAVLLYHPANAFDRPDLLVPTLSDLTVDRLLTLARTA